MNFTAIRGRFVLGTARVKALGWLKKKKEKKPREVSILTVLISDLLIKWNLQYGILVYVINSSSSSCLSFPNSGMLPYPRGGQVLYSQLRPRSRVEFRPLLVNDQACWSQS